MLRSNKGWISYCHLHNDYNVGLLFINGEIVMSNIMNIITALLLSCFLILLIKIQGEMLNRIEHIENKDIHGSERIICE